MLYQAVKRKSKEAVADVLKEGTSDVNTMRAVSPVSALHLASMHNQPDIAVQLVQAGAHIEARSARRGVTPLLTAAFAGASSTAIELLRHGADHRARDSRGFSTLDYAGKHLCEGEPVTDSCPSTQR